MHSTFTSPQSSNISVVLKASSFSLSVSGAEMASIIAHLPSPPLLVHNRTTLFSPLQKLSVSPIKERQNQGAVVAVKATGDSSESSTSISVLKSVQNLWDDSEDRLALIGLGFGAVLAIWTSLSLISAIDKLPILPGLMELIGILFSSWFIYRYLLFKPDREELFEIVKKTYSDILGK